MAAAAAEGRARPGSRAVAAVAAQSGFSPSVPSRGIKYRYGGTRRRCGATRWNPMPGARSARTMSASSTTCSSSTRPPRPAYELALALRPDRLRVHGNLGIVLHEMGDCRRRPAPPPHRAWTRSKTTPRTSPTWPIVLLKQKRHAEAMPYLERATRSTRRTSPASSTSGSRSRRSGHPEEGLAYLTRALELKPGRVDGPFGTWPSVHLARGDYEAAAARICRSDDARSGRRPGARARSLLGVVGGLSRASRARSSG